MRRLLNLRFGLPAAIFLVFLVLSAISYYYNLKSGERMTLDAAVSDALSKSERLARTAQTDVTRNKAQLDSDLGVESTDLRVSVLAVVRDDGTIQAAHRLDLVGKNIAQAVPGFDLARLKTVTQGRLPDVDFVQADPRLVRVLMPFVEAGTQSQIRSLASGAVYLEYDLSIDDAQSRWYAQNRWLVEAALATLIASFLSWVLYRRVARPLLNIEAASRALSENPASGISVPEAGPYELRQLAAGFNVMSARVTGARREIELQSAKLAAIVGSAMDAIITVDRDQHVTMINDAALSLFGYSREQAMGRHLDSFVPQRFRGSHSDKVRRFGQEGVQHRGMGQRGIFRALRSDGEEFPIRASISHLRVDGEELYTVILQDVRKELQAEEDIRQLTSNLELLVEQRTAKLNEATHSLEAKQLELEAARDELQNIFDSATVGIFLSRDRVLLRCNPKVASMLGYTAQELDGQSSRILYPSDAEFAHQGEILYGQLLESGSATTETQMARKDGSALWIRINARLLGEGPMQGMMLSFLEDVSIQHATSEALREAKEKAEEASRAKAQFLANMSHEIRTPMNAIIGMSHLALKTQLDKKQRGYIDKVHRAGESLLGIINDILDFSKIEAGKLTMENADFNLDDVMENLANLIGMKAADKGLELLFDTSPAVPMALVGDALRLGQVLVNLGNNAVKFTERGEIVVGIEKVRDHDDGVELHFWVGDSGIGMSAEQCERLFQSFSQADASTTRKYGGTGLGLAISKSLVESMRGRIWVESTEGKGSVFHFHARFGVQSAPQAPRMFKAEELVGVRLLVVDDNAPAREILATMAKGFGLQVDVANGGPEALRMVGAADDGPQPYELVLLDWKMPGMDGVDTAARLDSEALRHRPKVILVTAYGREDAMASASEAGAALQTVLTKPVHPSTLLESIGAVLGKGTDVTTRREVRADEHGEQLAGLKGARVLLVEDNDMNQELAMELLAHAGMSVVVANHGQEALDILARDPHFDGVLMDCQMPVMDGYTATREIRKNPAFQDLPIIAMTANAMAGDREKVLEAGMWDHIAKPIDVQAMYDTMAKWIRPGMATVIAEPGPGPAPDRSSETGNPGTLEALSLPGIDTRFGLAASMNREALYRNLLCRFRDGQGDFASQFALARVSSDPTAAQRCVHTLRGTAATIGAKGVQAAAEALETACKQSAPDAQIDRMLGAVLQELAPVLAGLQALGSEQAQAPTMSVRPRSDEEQAALRKQLVALLDRGDSRAIDLCDEQQDLLRAAYPGHWEAIAQSVHRFDFEAALSLAQQTR